jgi:hypothetical protein
MRLILAVVGGVMALLCLGGIGVTFVLYDDATKIDRSTPDQVVSSYLRVALVQRDEQQEKLFICDGSPDLSQVTQLREELEKREKDFDVTVTVSWGALTRSPAGQGQEDVRAELTISGSSDGQMRSRRNEVWDFRVIDQNGWRVCGAAKTA